MYPYLAILAIFVTIFVIIYPYLAKYTLILAIFALIWQYFAYVYLIRPSTPVDHITLIVAMHPHYVFLY